MHSSFSLCSYLDTIQYSSTVKWLVTGRFVINCEKPCQDMKTSSAAMHVRLQECDKTQETLRPIKAMKV